MAEPIPPTPDLVARLRGVPRRGKTLLIGVDGRGGSGKSTLARELERAAPDVTVIEFDDFYLPVRDRTARVENGDAEVGGDFDWRRLREQVLAPLSNDDPAAYQRYDWPTDELAEWHEVLPGGIVIVEGNYCTRRELFDLYDFTMWVDAPHEVRLARGIDRGGEDTLERWLTQYMPEEERYLAAEDPMRRVDLVLDGGGQ